MELIDLVQGSREWLEYRARRDIYNASDAPSMMGCSAYKTRQQLLREKFTGVPQQFDELAQKRLDLGHVFEELARPLAECIIGEDLMPVVGLEGKLSASFDGLTVAWDTNFEHKYLNQALEDVLSRDGVTGADLPLMYRVQMEQQHAVSQAVRTLFMASKWKQVDGVWELEQEYHCWYEPDFELRAEIMAGWDQFEKDLAAYVPEEEVTKPVAMVGRVPESLPALVVEVSGRVLSSNLDVYRENAYKVIESINMEPETDQDFFDAKATVKWCETVENRLKVSKASAQAQAETIDSLFRTIDDIVTAVSQKRIALDKAVKEREAQIKKREIESAQALLDAYIEAANKRLNAQYIKRRLGPFAEAAKNKRTMTGLKDSIAQALANEKIAVDRDASLFEGNRAYLKQEEADFIFLFADFSTVGAKAAEDFQALAMLRIQQHQQAEAERKRKTDEAAEAARVAAAQAVEKAIATPPPPPAVAPSATAMEEPRRNFGGSPVPIVASASTVETKPAADELGEDANLLVKLGVINERLGFNLTADFISRVLKIEPAETDRNAKLYRLGDVARMLVTLQAHISEVREGLVELSKAPF